MTQQDVNKQAIDLIGQLLERVESHEETLNVLKKFMDVISAEVQRQGEEMVKLGEILAQIFE